MITRVAQLGEKVEIVLDEEAMKLAKIEPGQEVSLEAGEDGEIRVTPKRRKLGDAEVEGKIDDIMRRYDKTMRRLA